MSRVLKDFNTMDSTPFEKALTANPEKPGLSGDTAGETALNAANELGFAGETPANDEMVEGYMDGFDPETPEPSANRSHSYRHGFANGRADREGRIAFISRSEASRCADEAMQKDAEA